MQLLRNLFFPILWLIITTVLFLLPGAAIPKINWLDKIWFDKWVHIGIFLIMVVLWVYGLVNKLKTSVMKTAIIVAVISLLYGVGIELTQNYFVPNRSFDPGDVIADAAGCLFGLMYCRRYIKK